MKKLKLFESEHLDVVRVEGYDFFSIPNLICVKCGKQARVNTSIGAHAGLLGVYVEKDCNCFEEDK